jgi:hypothetical protein
VPEHEGRSEYRFLEALIAQVQAALARRAAVRAGLWAAAGVAAALTGLLAADAATNFAAGVRAIVYGLAAAGGAGTVAAAAMVARARVLAPMCVAQLIERARPDLKNALITFMELRADPAADPLMRAAVGRQAARILAGADLGEFASPAGVGRAAWAAAAGACLLGATLWLTQGILFGRGPAAAAAGPMIGGVKTTAHESAAGPRESTSAPHAAAGVTAGTLAAALAADKDKFDRLAEALGEKPAGASGGASAGGAPQGTSGGDANRARSVNPRAHPNGREQPTARGADGQDPGSSPTPGDKRDGASGDRLSGHGPTEAEASARTGGAKATRHEPDAGMSGDLSGVALAKPEASCDPQKSPPAPAAGSNAAASGPSETASGSRGAGPGGGPADATPKPPPGHPTAPPLPRRPQPEAFSEKTLDAMRKVRRLIDEADKKLREGEVTDAFLGRMGMSNAEFRRFVAAWQRRIETAAPDTSAVPVAPGQAAGAASKVEFIPAGAGTDARPVGGLAPAASAIQGGAVQGADAGVSVRLRPAVSAYFEQVGKLAAEKTDEKAAPKDVPK